MNKFLLSLTILLITPTSYAQITSFRIDSKPEGIVPYDSLENISENNFRSLIGQTLFLRPLQEAKEKGYYSVLDLLTTPSVDFFAERYMQDSNSQGILHYVDYKANSKYFEILEIFEKKKIFKNILFIN